MSDPALTNVFAFTDRREDVAQFFEEIIGLRRGQPHDREDEDAGPGYVPWFHVADLAAAFERAQVRGATVGGMRDAYFLARDPDGRIFGVRQWR